MGRHVFERHTSEVQVRLEADDRADLYAEAARALAELVTERLADERVEAEVEVDGRDAEALLVAFVNELIFRTDTEEAAFDDVVVHDVSDTALRATVRGRRLEAVRTAVKAATFHDVRVEAIGGGFRGRLVLDV